MSTDIAHLNEAARVHLDDLDRKLINRLQDGLPVVSKPYATVAEELGIEEELLLERLKWLLKTRILTRFGPMFDIAQMGGAFCLCAMQCRKSVTMRSPSRSMR